MKEHISTCRKKRYGVTLLFASRTEDEIVAPLPRHVPKENIVTDAHKRKDSSRRHLRKRNGFGLWHVNENNNRQLCKQRDTCSHFQLVRKCTLRETRQRKCCVSLLKWTLEENKPCMLTRGDGRLISGDTGNPAHTASLGVLGFEFRSKA